MNPKDSVEAPPRPEPPYPGSEDIDLTPVNNPPPARKSNTDTNPLSGPASNSQRRSAPAEEGTWAGHYNNKDGDNSKPTAGFIERPKKIDEEGGNYIYDRTITKPGNTTTQPTVSRPTKTTADGEYVYDQNDKSTEPVKQPVAGSERPIFIKKDGEYQYKLPGKKGQKPHSVAVRIGVMTPPTIVNAEHSNVDFATVYGKGAQPTILADYEWKAEWFGGQVGAQITTGIFNASGKGVFVKTPPEGTTPLETFTFLMFPNALNLFYKFKVSENQVIVPYVTGGADYFTFVELRDDSKPAKFGGSLGVGGAAGLNFLIDNLDKRAIQQLNNEYGIKHVYLSLEVRVIVGINKAVDISSQVFNAGICIDF